MTQNQQTPYLSVVVAMISDTAGQPANARNLAGCLAALARQSDAPPMEIIVPYHAGVRGMEDVRAAWPGVRFLPVEDGRIPLNGGGTREHHDLLRARGLAAACGEVVALVEDVGQPEPGWAAAVRAAHAGEFAGVGGAIENGVDRGLNWAVYFCDFGRYQNPLPEGEAVTVSDANLSFKRRDLDAVRAIWQEAFREPEVNWALRARGGRLTLARGMVVRQHRELLSLAAALRERVIWARSYAAMRAKGMGRPARVVRALMAPLLPFVLLLRIGLTAQRRKRHFGDFLRSAPLIFLLLVAWSYGELRGYLAPGARR